VSVRFDLSSFAGQPLNGFTLQFILPDPPEIFSTADLSSVSVSLSFTGQTATPVPIDHLTVDGRVFSLTIADPSAMGLLTTAIAGGDIVTLAAQATTVSSDDVIVLSPSVPSPNPSLLPTMGPLGAVDYGPPGGDIGGVQVPAIPTPEPTSTTLVMLGLVALTQRRKRA